MKRVLSILFLATILMSMTSPKGTVDNSKTRVRLKALMMYQFATKIDWPKKYKTGSFVIGVYGNEDLYNEIEKNHASKPVGSQPIKVKYFSNSSQITQCHILYVDKSKSSDVKSLARKYKPTSTLIVSEYENGLNHGAIINFVVRNNKNTFELSKSNAQAHRLVISEYIIGFAINV